MVMNMVSDTLTGVGSSTVFTGDPDIQLVGDALPFAIKVYEALLEQNPKHQGLIVTTGSLFVMYANAYVQGPADMEHYSDYDAYAAGRARALELYKRGAVILNTGLEERFPGLGQAIKDGDVSAFLPRIQVSDTELIYWTVAGTLSAFALNPLDLTLGMQLKPLTALINQVYELNPNYNQGTLDDFFVLFNASVPSYLGGDPSMVDTYFQRAVEKSGGLLASPYVSYAEAVCIPAGNYDGFKQNLEAALAIDIDKEPSVRLMNLISQRKAQYLLDNASYFFYFIEGDSDEWYDWSEDETTGENE
jgi:predicted anti-sigma-YlaC factor YlaD